LRSRKRIRLNSLSSHFYKRDLNCESYEDNDKEENVVKEAFEDIQVMFSDFSRIDLVENLHKDEDLEKECVVNQLLSMLTFLEIIRSVFVFRITENALITNKFFSFFST
jgi:hypothetical protein